MIVKSGDADRFVEHPPASLLAALVFGPDQGLVRERAERLAKTVVQDLTDAFRVTELDEVTLSSDNARLFDEAAAISMLGGRRVVRVRSAGNGLAKLFESFLNDPKGDALIVVEGGELAKSASLRKVFEEASNAAAVQCYADLPQGLSNLVRTALKAEGLGIDDDALEDVVSRLGGDRGIARREIEKLALFARGQKRIRLEDVRAIMGDEAEAQGDEVCDAAGEGNFERLDLALERMKAADLSAISILRMALAHFQKLLLAIADVERGQPVDSVVRRLRPPLHFARVASFKAQVSRWSTERLAEALALLFEAEVLCKTTGIPAQVVCARSLFSIAALARAR